MKRHVGHTTNILLCMSVPLLAACSDPAAPAMGTPMELELTGLRPLDHATEGTYELWVEGADGTPVSAGRFELHDDGGPETVPFRMPVDGAARIALTLEPPGDTDALPSEYEMMAGRFDGSTSTLSIEGSITDGRPLEPYPGHHSLFTSSNNVAEGYPSEENAGIWMFSIYVNVNKHKSREVKLTPLERAWTYEGWVVFKQGTPDEVWVPYGKFRPDLYGLLTSRDNTGSGPFSGDEDYVNGGVEDVPGDEWTTNIFDLPVPGGLQLPFALDSVDAAGNAIWHHVITIEPAFDEGEPLLSDRPFLLQPYENPIGRGRPSDPREILYQDNDPKGTARSAR
ncbi:MAG TPA: anti-sigma factor [Longimicrobiales bacterium]|nr:anti-sigma factor [Longimicrobiales bacterium]